MNVSVTLSKITFIKHFNKMADMRLRERGLKTFSKTLRNSTKRQKL